MTPEKATALVARLDQALAPVRNLIAELDADNATPAAGPGFSFRDCRIGAEQ